ncbi:hypothetical protein SE17_03950 [Kouleothrix aurantiaca]|uniref:Restriction endonuclease n=1 Tax=Kouleothrix aurantiaca TaxID=186479 RepID=A0A0P9FCG7_9CHLR|nr:hypothetical protein SE17_03950 [Kouleothrix aurantiaca]
MQRAITLFEHETAPFDWSDRHLIQLEQLRTTVGSDVLRATTRHGQRVLQATQYVGIVRMGRETIQILPKIYRSDTSADPQSRERAATRNLLHMLVYAGQIDIREQELAALMQRDTDWFETLTRIFATHLAKEWQRGPTRSYQVLEDDLTILKGTWRISQQIRRPDRRHMFAVAYDEFTIDNQLNRILRYVVECLWRQTRDHNNRRMLGNLRQWMESVTLLPAVRALDAPPELITRLNQRYKPLLNLARLFLGVGGFQLAMGDADHFTLVFDMNLLFEAFIAGFIGRHRAHVLPSALQDCNLLVQTRGATRYLARIEGTGVFLLKPDLAFQQGTTFVLLLDTKYKTLDTRVRNLGVSQADVYQMFAYAQRYDAAKVLLLYPQHETMTVPLRRIFQLEGTTDRQIVVATLNIRVDLAKKDDRACLIRELYETLYQEIAPWPQQ